MAQISLKGISKIYAGGIVAVHDFDLEIKDKEFVVLVGPSGCGKSTTLRMIAGLEEISKGELYIGDELVNDVPPKDRDISMVFQNYALYPHMTVYKNIAFGLELRKVPKDEIDKKVREAAKMLGIEEYLNRKPKALSGGQRQRVALGRAMVRRPSVFLLDEPLSNLDAKLRATMRSEIIKLHRELGITFIYVTHDQTEAMTMGDRIVVMKDGYIQQVDTPQNLYERPCNAFVAGFIGSPQMNLLPVTIEKHQESFVALLGDAILPISKEQAAGDVLEAQVGKSCTLGIRPEHIKMCSRGEENCGYGSEAVEDQSITAMVDLAEMMGSETYLYLDIMGNKAIARISGYTDVKGKERVELTLDHSKFHLFDGENGEVIFN